MSEGMLRILHLGTQWPTQDPFIFCAYHLDHYPGGNDQLGPNVPLAGRNIGQDFAGIDGWNMYHGSTVPGFPAHPHCGFETVTVVTKGLVDHSDSLGATGRFGHGDVQWLTSGKGVQHAEMFPLVDSEENPFELFQLWLNLPKRSKKVEPHYKMLWKEDIPLITETDDHGRKTEVNLIAGSYKETRALSPTPDSWAADPENAVQIWTIKMEANAQFTIPAEKPGLNRSVYFYRGDSASISGADLIPMYGVDLDSSMDTSIANGDQPGYFFFLQGKPINEPLVQHGPFVANTEQEIVDAYNEFRQTQFGGWPWSDSSPVNDRETGRFAKHANGVVENR